MKSKGFVNLDSGNGRKIGCRNKKERVNEREIEREGQRESVCE
jgi:hypothetical protein